MSTHETEKAQRYIAQLDQARCNSQWAEVPELIRKVEKHAPHRKCLALTAKAEAQVIDHLSKRPTTSAATSQNTPLPTLISPLLTAIEGETAHKQDAFQATVCLTWIHFVLEETSLAIARSPKDFGAVIPFLSSSGQGLTAWTHSCILKGAYIKGFSQEKAKAVPEAVETYNSVLPFLSKVPALQSAPPHFRSWAERLVGRLCLIESQNAASGSIPGAALALQAFRFWAKVFESTPGRSTSLQTTATDTQTLNNRRAVWKAYYDALSSILQQGRAYALAPAPADTTVEVLESVDDLDSEEIHATRLQQRAELKRVETTYETLLLGETRFPKASQTNPEVEQWVEAVMRNWRILCGPSWGDDELGEGGKAAVGRGVLDMLYRAATKTFHSTQVLRHLFTVHASLAEFDLALKAFETYLDLVNKAKDRAERSGEEDVGLDRDDIILRTAAEAVRILSRYGARNEAERADSVGRNIDKWLKQDTPAAGVHQVQEDPEAPTEEKVSSHSKAIAYRAIAISRANWARWTYDAASRNVLQAQAVQYFQKALDPQLDDTRNVETLYSLSMLLAEMRDIPGAIKVVKRALASPNQPSQAINPDGAISEGRPESDNNFMKERKFIPLWHLLALLLTARSDFDTAARSCEAAFEQFADPAALFGPEAADDSNPTYRSEHLKDVPEEPQTSKRTPWSRRAVIDRMGAFEKEGVIQVKITQLALIETIEGPKAAVDECDELLALYARLFGDPKAGQVKLQTPSTALPPPKSAAPTIRGSILGRPKSVRTSNEKPAISVSDGTSTAVSRPSTRATQRGGAPSIKVTDEDSIAEKANGHHHHHLFHHKDHKDGKSHGIHHSGSVKLQKRSASLRRTQADGSATPSDATLTIQPKATGAVPTNSTALDAQGAISSNEAQQNVGSADQPLRDVAHNEKHDVWPPPAGHSKQPPTQDVRLPVPHPQSDLTSSEPHFTTTQERRHQISLLVNVWLVISGLYVRAAMYEDAKGAVDEAYKLVQGLEAEVAQLDASARAFAAKSWGGGKSVEELWGDVWAQSGEVVQAQSLPHAALSKFEKALTHYPNHPAAIVGAANLMLDIYARKIPAEPITADAAATTTALSMGSTNATGPDATGEQRDVNPSQQGLIAANATPTHPNPNQHSVSPEELNRIAARDRAYSLLSQLTKLGTGWDHSEAWFALARAYEESGQIERARSALWWVVQLEDTRPVREWRCVGAGGSGVL